MAKYGYRVFTFSVGRGASWKRAEAFDGSASGYEEVFYGLLKVQLGKVLEGSAPDLRADPRGIGVLNGGGNVDLVRIDSVSKHGRLVRLVVTSGRVGAHERLLDGGGAYNDISTAAASREFRLDFYFPGSGETGLLVAEVRDRYAPVPGLLRWVAHFDACRFADDSSSDEYWRLMRVQQVADRDYLLGIIERADKTSVTVIDAETTTAAGRPKKINHTLTVPATELEERRKIADEITGWLKNEQSGTITRILTTLGYDRDRLRSADLCFTNVVVRINGDGTTLAVSPDRVRDVFTYTFPSEGRPDDAEWDGSTKERAAELAILTQSDIEL